MGHAQQGFGGAQPRRPWGALNALRFSFDPLSRVRLSFSFFYSPMFREHFLRVWHCAGHEVSPNEQERRVLAHVAPTAWAWSRGDRADRQGPGAATFSLGCLRGASLGSGVVSKMVITSSGTFRSVAISPRGGADKIAPLAPYAAWLKPWRRELQRSGTWLGAFQSRLHAQSPRPCSEAPGQPVGRRPAH